MDYQEDFSDFITDADGVWNQEMCDDEYKPKEESDKNDCNDIDDDSNDSNYIADEGEDIMNDMERDKINPSNSKKRLNNKDKGKRKSRMQVNKVKCPWCESRAFYGDGFGFLYHKKSKHFWGEFSCNQCSFTCDFAKDLTDHMMSENHLNSNKVVCPNCKWNVPVQEMETHYQECVKEVLSKCEMCNFTTKRRTCLHEHMKLKHYWGVFKCGSCKYTAHFARDILEHTQGYKHNAEVKCPTRKCSTKLSAASIGSHYEECSKEHHRQIKARSNSNRGRTKKLCDICGNNVAKAQYNKHVERCQLKSAEGQLDQKCGPAESYCCEFCGKEYSGKGAQSGLITHKKNVHLKEQGRASKYGIFYFVQGVPS